MKIAYLLGSLNPGGAEKLALTVLDNAKKHDLNFLCIYRHHGKLDNDFFNTGVKMIHLAPRGKYDLFSIIRLKRLLKKECVDIIHVHQVGDAMLAIIATIFSKIKVVYTLHGISYNRGGLLNGVRFGLKYSSKNIFVSEYQKQFYISDYGLNKSIVSKSCVVYNGIDFDCINENHYRNKNVGNKIIIGSVGSFVAGRNQLFICRFLDELNKKGVDFEFSFIGGKSIAEPSLFENCVDYCNNNGLADKVHFLGVRNDVPELLQKMDAFIYASVDDTFGIAVVEAISSGIPVFVNDWDVMIEITDNGKLATIYKTEDVDDLMFHFNDFVNNRKKYLDNAKNSAASIRRMYEIDQHIESIKELYEKL